MHSKKRSRNVARPRQLAMALAKDLTQMSLPDIGDAFGNRDHTTVLHCVSHHRNACEEKNHDINRDYHVLEQVLKGEQAAHNHGTNCGQMAPSSSAGFLFIFLPRPILLFTNSLQTSKSRASTA